MHDALALVELATVSRGLAVLDALAKRAQVRVQGAGVIEPGRHLVLFDGALAEVEEAHAAAVEAAGSELVDAILLPYAHPALLPGLGGRRRVHAEVGCVGVVDGSTVSSTLAACDRALKNAEVALARFRVSGGLGGRASFTVAGSHADVIAAVHEASAVLGSRLARAEVIPRPAPEVLAAIRDDGGFRVGS